MKVGEKIQELREQQNLSRYRLSKDTGVSGDHIRGIEEGTRQPTIDTLNRLVTALGSSLVEIFNDDTECSYLTDDEKRLLENYRRASEEQKSALLNMSDVLNK
jgi:transcriptional regulator with XRE-family HTH domain